MTIQDLKTMLVNYLDITGRRQEAVNQEVVDHMIKENGEQEVECLDIAAFQVNGTTVFLSDVGLPKPNRVLFLDLKSRKSFLHECEV